MGYYLRVLGKNNPSIPVTTLEDALKKKNLTASFEVTAEIDNGEWLQLVVRDDKGNDLFAVEKNDVAEGELGEEEIEEFKDSVAEEKPESAARWLVEYFDTVKVIYAFQILNAVNDEASWSIVDEVKLTIWKLTGGILQADNEGFSNEQGHHILWQFFDDVTGPFDMAVLEPSGKWVSFQMELGDKKQREDFLNGKAPSGGNKKGGLFEWFK